GEERAALHRLAVEMDGARPADAGVAAHGGPGQVQPLAEREHEELARLDVELVAHSVDRHGDRCQAAPPLAGPRARRNSRTTAPCSAAHMRRNPEMCFCADSGAAASWSGSAASSARRHSENWSTMRLETSWTTLGRPSWAAWPEKRRSVDMATCVPPTSDGVS